MVKEETQESGISTVTFAEGVQVNINSRSISSNTSVATGVPADAVGQKHDFKILEAKSAGEVIEEPNDKIVKNTTIYYPTGSSTSFTDSTEDFYTNYTQYNMGWINEGDYMIIETAKPCNVYVATINRAYTKNTGASSATIHNFNGNLKVEKLINGSYADVTIGANQKLIVADNIGKIPAYELFISRLPAGTWKFSTGDAVRIDGYWFLEEIEDFDDSLKINKVFEEEVLVKQDLENCNEINFTETGKIFTYKRNGEKLQIGCSREEYEALKGNLGEPVLKFNTVKW